MTAKLAIMPVPRKDSTVAHSGFQKEKRGGRGRGRGGGANVKILQREGRASPSTASEYAHADHYEHDTQNAMYRQGETII